jgi:hypothetical protein
MKEMLHGTDGAKVQDGKIHNTTQNEYKCSQFQIALLSKAI